MQVSNATRPDVPAHLAIVQALHDTDDTTRPQDSTPPSAKALLTPFLAYNLGLEYHAAPFYTASSQQDKSATHTAQSLGVPAEQASCGAVRLSRWRGSSGDVASPAVLPVADAVWVSSVRQPDASLLQSQLGTEHIAAEAAAHDHPRRSDDQQQQKHGKTQADDGFDSALVAALQSYFKQHPRLLAQGDVFAVSMADIAGTAEVLASLLRDTSISTDVPSTLVYFRVDKMLPASNTSLLVDPRRTAMTMKGSCSCTMPIGLRPSPQLRAPAEGAATAPVHAPATGEAACLSRSALAAYALAPRLPGAGVLLPAWRQVAKLLALMNHQGAEASNVCVSVLIHGPSGCGKSTAVSAAAAALGLNVVPYSCHEFIGQSDAAVAAALKASLESAQDFAPAVLYLEDLSALCSAEQAQGGALGGSGGAVRLASALSQCIADGCSAASKDGNEHGSRSPGDPQEHKRGPRVSVVASTEAVEDVAAPLRRCFTHELHIDAPDKDARLSILEDFVHASSSLEDVDLEQIASQAAGMLPSDLMAISADAASSAALQALGPELAAMLDGKEGSSEAHSQSEASAEGLRLTSEHYETGLQNLRQRTAVAIGAPQVPNVQWEDVGGLEDVKASILETVDLPLRHPHLFSQGLRRRSGVLLYGPPGTGKTLLAKAVATECQLNFLSVKGPELINMYIGESERQVREVFARARRARPCVVFFDELDSLAPARGAGADSGGVMDRVVAQLLAEVDGAQQSGEGSASASASHDLFIIGATNRPDLLDSALMRPGRLDKLLYVGVAEDVASKAKVLRALTRKFKLVPTVDLDAVARECAPTYTGADLYALCADAWMAGLKRIIAEAEEGSTTAGGSEEVTVDQCDFWAALRELRPSLSPDELERYRVIKEQHEAQA
ncbi:g9752 [Coccomyxa viridis]|uniref:Peroxisomal ATPase PEX6 n=1 Tax=Coccomyxa viridis TaxID=1274662 RepID=A0ABP1G429_9CHLO